MSRYFCAFHPPPIATEELATLEFPLNIAAEPGDVLSMSIPSEEPRGEVSRQDIHEQIAGRRHALMRNASWWKGSRIVGRRIVGRRVVGRRVAGKSPSRGDCPGVRQAGHLL